MKHFKLLLLISILLVFSSLVSGVTDADLRLGGTYYWDFNNNATLYDLISGMNATISSGSPTIESSIVVINKSIYFDQNNEGYKTSTNFVEGLSPTVDGFMITGWFYATSKNQYGVIMAPNMASNHRGIFIRNFVIGGADDFRASAHSADCTTNNIISIHASNYSTSQWYFFALVYQPNNLLFYFNTTLMGNLTTVGFCENGEDYNIGWDNNYATRDWYGYLDEFYFRNTSEDYFEVLSEIYTRQKDNLYGATYPFKTMSFTNISANPTPSAGTEINFSTDITDDDGISSYTFSWYNETYQYFLVEEFSGAVDTLLDGYNGIECAVATATTKITANGGQIDDLGNADTCEIGIAITNTTQTALWTNVTITDWNNGRFLMGLCTESNDGTDYCGWDTSSDWGSDGYIVFGLDAAGGVTVRRVSGGSATTLSGSGTANWNAGDNFSMRIYDGNITIFYNGNYLFSTSDSTHTVFNTRGLASGNNQETTFDNWITYSEKIGGWTNETEISTTDMGSSLRGYWSLDSDTISGATLTADKGSIDGTLINSPSQVTGLLGGALDFTKANTEWVNMDEGLMSATDWIEMSIHLCLKVNDKTVADQYPIHFNEQRNYYLTYSGATVGTAGQFCFAGYDGSFDKVCDTNTQDNTWSCYVGVKNSTHLILYKNGTLVGSTASGTATTNTGKNALGGKGDTPTFLYDGVLDELHIYDRALSGTEVASLFDSITGTPIVPYVPVVNASYKKTIPNDYTTFNVSFFAEDSLGNIGSVSEVYVLGGGDNFPNVNITVNNSNPFILDNVLINVNASDDINLSYCWFYNNQSNTNSTPLECNLTNVFVIASPKYSDILLIGYANDSSNQLSSSQLIISVEPYVPQITEFNLTDGYKTNLNESINWSINLSGNVEYFVYVNYTGEMALYQNGTSNHYTFNLTSNGRYDYVVGGYSRGEFGPNSTLRYIILDTNAPFLYWYSPEDNITTENNTIFFNGTCIDDNELFLYNVTVLNQYGVQTSSFEFRNLSVISFNNFTDLNLNHNQKNTILWRCTDAHTYGEDILLKNYDEYRGELTFFDKTNSFNYYTVDFGYVLNNKFYKLSENSINQYNIKSFTKKVRGDWEFGTIFDMPNSDFKIGFKINKHYPQLTLLHKETAHFVLYDKFYIDFDASVCNYHGGFNVSNCRNGVPTMFENENFYYIYYNYDLRNWYTPGDRLVFFTRSTGSLNTRIENRTVYHQGIPPILSNVELISFGINNNLTNTNKPSFNITCMDEGGNGCIVRVENASDGYDGMTSIRNCTNIINNVYNCTIINDDLLSPDGIYNICFTGSDNLGNNHSVCNITTNIEIDTLKPSLNVTSPINSSFLYGNFVNVTYEVNDLHLDKVFYSLNEEENISIYIDYSNFSLKDFPKGINDLRVCANDSLSQINCTNLIYFYGRNNYLNFSAINRFDNTSLFNYSVYVDSVKYNISNGSDFILDLDNGTYDFIFEKDLYFNITKESLITNSSSTVNFESFQSYVYITVNNLVDGSSVDNVTINIYDGINQTFNTGLSNVGFFYLNSSNYTIFVEIDNYENYTTSFDILHRQNLSINIGLSYLASFNLYDEFTLGEFNLSSPDTIQFNLHCLNNTITTLINSSNFTMPISCEYTKFNFRLYYGSTSYYRSFILTIDELDDVPIYLIDLETTSSIFNSLVLDDLMDQFDNPAIYIFKNTPLGTVQITADYVDIEKKIGFYAIEGHLYDIEVRSSNRPTLNLGEYTADIPGSKNLRAYSIGVYPEPSGFSSTVQWSSGIVNDSGTTYAFARYRDELEVTENITWTLYENSVDGPVLYTTTSTEQDIELRANISSYLNSTIASVIEINHPEVGYQQTGSNIHTVSTIVLLIKNFINSSFMDWFLTIILSLIALMASAVTANIVCFIIIGIGLFFSMIGWFGISNSIIALASIIAIISFLKQKDREIRTL